jgi:hypothetical protein
MSHVVRGAAKAFWWTMTPSTAGLWALFRGYPKQPRGERPPPPGLRAFVIGWGHGPGAEEEAVSEANRRGGPPAAVPGSPGPRPAEQRRGPAAQGARVSPVPGPGPDPGPVRARTGGC